MMPPKYGQTNRIRQLEEAAGIVEPEPPAPPPPRNAGKTPPAPPVGNERTYVNPKEQPVTTKKSWWPF